jgi:hypothetical protein
LHLSRKRRRNEFILFAVAALVKARYLVFHSQSWPALGPALRYAVLGKYIVGKC